MKFSSDSLSMLPAGTSGILYPFRPERLAETVRRVLAGWVVDENWLELLRGMIAGVDVVSFDVFDTAITRVVETPVDVFVMMESVLVEKYGSRFSGFALSREQAEKVARQKLGGGGEVTQAGILEELAILLPVCRGCRDEIAALEWETERHVQLAVPDILTAVRLCREAGKEVIFVSDMYLPHQAVQAMLEDAGYPEDISLLVSSVTRRKKADGTQWQILKQHVGAGARILHIGDNPHSDGETARACGLKTLSFDRVRSPARPGGPLTPAVLPFSLQARLIRLQAHSSSATADFMTDLGRSWGAVVVGTYVRWLSRRAQALGLRHIFFCARDGWLPLEAWKAADYEGKTGISSSYLYVSRRSLMLAAAATVSTPERLGFEAVETLIRRYGIYTVGRILARNGLSEIAALVEEAERRFSSLDHVLQADDNEALHILFQNHAEAIHAVLQGELAQATRYLLQEGLADGAVGMVDVGWNGSLQSAIVRILKHAGYRPRLYGFYCGLWNDAQKNRPAAGWMEAAFGSDFIHDPEQYGIRNVVDIIENLFAAADGTTTGYREANGRMVATLAPIPAVSEGLGEQHQELIQPFQDGVLEVLKALFHPDQPYTGPAGILCPEMLEPEVAGAAIDRLSLSPSQREMRSLGAILHASDVAHDQHVPLIPELDMDAPEQVSPEFICRSWPVGSVLTLLSRLEGEERDAFRKAALTQFAIFDVRTKEQFQ